MGLGWHQRIWQQAASAAQRGFAATRPGIAELRHWLNTGWDSPANDSADAEPHDLDPHDPLLPSQRTPPHVGVAGAGRTGPDSFCRRPPP
jgi:hypothetical protein